MDYMADIQILIPWVACVLKRLLRFHDWSPDIKSLITRFPPSGTIYYGNYKLSLCLIKSFFFNWR